MTARTLGATTLNLSPIIMGLWQAGGQYWTGIDDAETTRAVQACLDAGVTSFDTAEEYGGGHSEQILGRALQGRRHEAVVMTKVFSNHLRAEAVQDACERSLRNLGTDYIDLYQIHWPSGSWGSEVVPIQETMGALLRLQEAGKIRHIGVSNFNVAQMREAAACGRIESLQPPYSLFWRHIDREIRPYCEAENMSILAYSPLAQGVLTGRFRGDHEFDKGDNRRANKMFLPEHRDRIQGALDKLRPIAARNGITLAQLALAWLIAQPNSFAIAGARNQTQVTDNAKAMGVQLSAEDLTEVDHIGRDAADPFGDDPVPWTWQP